MKTSNDNNLIIAERLYNLVVFLLEEHIDYLRGHKINGTQKDANIRKVNLGRLPNSNVVETTSENDKIRNDTFYMIHKDGRLKSARLLEQEGIKRDKEEEDIEFREKNYNNEKFIILLTNVGKEIFIHSDLILKLKIKEKEKKTNILEYYFTIQKEDTKCVIISNRNKLIYAVVLICPGKNKKKNSKYAHVYHIQEYVMNKFKVNLNFYVNFNFSLRKFLMRKICFINFTQIIWDFQFFKKNICKRVKYIAHLSKCLCFVLSYHLLHQDYKLFLAGLINRSDRIKGPSVFHIVDDQVTRWGIANGINFLVNDELEQVSPSGIHDRSGSRESGLSGKSGERNDKRGDELEKWLMAKCKKKEKPFFKQIWSIFSLLKEENSNFLKFYNLENYTRVFIYNCEKLNRNQFIQFLKKMPNFHIHSVNLNTLFGSYFSQTEQNILNVFKKCQRILKNTTMNLCLIIDGIDVIANTSSSGENDLHEHLPSSSSSSSLTHSLNIHILGEREANDNGRILTTLLLCLDSIDNHTQRRHVQRRLSCQMDEHDGGDTIQKGGNIHKDDTVCKSATNRGYVTRGERNMHVNVANQVHPKGGKERPHRLGKEYYDENSDNSGKISSTEEDFKKRTKCKNLSAHVTFDFKKLEKIYKERYIQCMRRKKKKNLSIIVLSDLDLKKFDISLIRAGRFFHFIKYS
ncbi:hypothetical protein, conserved [Plasmodium gonderi]|uniref:ATPase AAA-type core domain-containing protein n=1 Tax=Plasmodium gonderi TaxID=77519 RepID=A0A1Y1JEL1_PLAGO|nr:hypothetical protein, conserved [Plasmodium gonderi]GAW80690.1 hypothetical protein, conserved [Plasmodium gonderi]